MEYTKPLAQLIDQFQKLPGIGPKSAQRMAFFMLKMPLSEVEKFATTLVEAKKQIKYCHICHQRVQNSGMPALLLHQEEEFFFLFLSGLYAPFEHQRKYFVFED